MPPNRPDRVAQALVAWRENSSLPIAIVLNLRRSSVTSVTESAGAQFGPSCGEENQSQQLRRSIEDWTRQGFRHVFYHESPEEGGGGRGGGGGGGWLLARRLETAACRPHTI